MTDIESIVGSIGDLPSMPHVANLVMQKVGDPDTTPKKLNEIISRDQGLTTKVLKTANSAFYGRSRSVTKLTDAISTVGFNAIKSLVVAAAVRDLFNSFGLIEKLLWDHSLGVAFASRLLAKEFEFPRIEEAFLAGLLHDVGKVIFNIKTPEKMTIVVENVYNNPGGASFCELEREVFGFDHAELGRVIARKWNFSEEIELVIGKHHQVRPTRDRSMPPLTYIVHLANGICHKLEIGPTKNPELRLSELASAKILDLDEETLDELAERIRETFSSDMG